MMKESRRQERIDVDTLETLHKIDSFLHANFRRVNNHAQNHALIEDESKTYSMMKGKGIDQILMV